MTGFARADGAFNSQSWVWEIKSVNGRGLDLRFRLPSGFDSLEPRARRIVSDRLKRGNVNLSLAVNDATRAESYRINRPLLKQLVEIIREIEGTLDAGAPSIDGLLALRGVIELVEPEEDTEARAAREDAILKTLTEAIGNLERTRAAEGQHLFGIITGLIDDVQRLTVEAEQVAALRPEIIRQRLLEQIKELSKQIPLPSEERLGQEIAILITKADIREELDRLKTHIASARVILEAGGGAGGAGRQLDFLMQEFNREANTLCSKSGDKDLTQIGLGLKLAIDRMREQVQNVE